MILTSTEGQKDLPRYFAQVFKMLGKNGVRAAGYHFAGRSRVSIRRLQSPARLQRSKFTTRTFSPA